MTKYVISHKLRYDNYDNVEEIFKVADKTEMYAKTIYEFDEEYGKEREIITWTDVFGADTFDTYEEAQKFLDTYAR